MKRGSTKVGSFRLLWLVLIGALVLSTASCEFFYRMFNQPPQAGFTVGPSTAGAAPFTVTVSAATSSDPDENIESYSWNFGDGATGSGAAASHTYTAEGTYTIVLTVTDKYGETDTATKTIYVTPEETGPSASFTASPTSGTSPLTVSFDAGDSTYDEGTIQSYSWNFGDGHTGVGVITSHTYSTSTAKTYTVTLTVRGTDGETSTATKSISVSTSSGGGTSTSDDPSARFDAAPTIGVAPLRCEFDPADSEAAEGHTLIKFIWSYGDGDSEWDINPNTMDHVFTTDTTSEIFSVTLIVLDNDAGNDSITKTVKVYNHKPIAGFEIGNPPGGDAGVGAIEYPNPNVPGNAPDADDLDEWIADDVTYGSLGAEATVTVVIRSMEIPDATWRALTTKANQEDLVMADGTSATTSSSPSAPHDYADHNYSYDPEGQKWTGDVWPAWFPALSGQAWGIKYLYIDWGDGSGEVQVAYTNTGDVVAWHDYAFSGSGAVTRTIKVTAEDWLGYKSAAFSRVVTLKEGHEGDTEI